MEDEVDRLVVTLVGDLSNLDKAAEEADLVIGVARQANEELLLATQAASDGAIEFSGHWSDAADVFSISTTDIVSGFEQIEEATKSAQSAIADLTDDTDRQSKTTEQTTETTKTTSDAFADLRREFEQTGEQIKDLVRREEELEAHQQALNEENQRAVGTLDAFMRGLVSLPGPTGGFVGGLQGMATSVIAFVTASGPLIPIILAVGAAITAVVGGFSLMKSAVSTVIGEIERLGPAVDRATAMGESLGNIQALSFAMEQLAGMTSSQVEMSMTRLQRSIGQAALHGGRAAKEFQGLNLDLQKLSGMNAAEQFKEVASAMAKVENHTERAAVAQRLFGSQGKNILAALEAQADAIALAEEKARELGITLTDVQANAIDNAGDSMALLGKVTEGWVMQLTAELAPAVQAITELLIEWIPEAGNFSVIISATADAVVQMLGDMADASQIAFGLFKATQGDLAGAALSIGSGLNKEISTQLKERVRLVEEANRAQKEGNKDTELAIDEHEKLNEKAQKYADSLEDQVAFLRQKDQIGGEKNKKIFEFMSEGVDPKIIESMKEYQAILDGISKSESEKKKAQSLVDKYKTSEERVLESAKELKDFFDRGLINETTFTRGMEALQKELDKNIDKANKFWEAMNGVDQQYTQGAEGIRGAIITKRAEGLRALDPNMSEDRSRFLARGDATREGSEKKLISVLELLEQHLRANPDPNKIALKTVGTVSGVESTP